MDWRPIESAPKDGTWFQGYRPKAETGRWQRIVICRWDDEFQDFVWPDSIFDIYEDAPNERDAQGFFVHDFYEAGGTLTHWAPLLPTPTA